MKLKLVFLLLLAFTVPSATFAQKRKNKGPALYQNKKSKSDFFGSRKASKKIMKNKSDKVRPFGLQVQLGATLTLVKPEAQNKSIEIPAEGTYKVDPQTRAGIMTEIGFVHMNMKAKSGARQRIIDYIDYGIGFHLWRGVEQVDFTRLGTNEVDNSSKSTFQFGNVNARFGVHKLQYLTKKKTFFIDHSLGINFEYRLLNKTTEGDYLGKYPLYDDKSTKPYWLNLHYDFAFGFRVAKGKYLEVGAQVPFAEFLSRPTGYPTFKWFSSSYLPFMVKLKYINLFPARNNKQACWLGDEDQRKLNQQYLDSQ